MFKNQHLRASTSGGKTKFHRHITFSIEKRKIYFSMLLLVLCCASLIADSVITVYPTKDGYVRLGSNSNKDYSNSNKLEVKNEGDMSKNTRETYLFFDLTSKDLPEVDSITSIKLKLYYRLIENADNHILNFEFLPLANFNEATLNAENSPGLPFHSTSISFNNEKKYYSVNIDIKNIDKNPVDITSNKVFFIKISGEQEESAQTSFASLDDSRTNRHPALVIHYKE